MTKELQELKKLETKINEMTSVISEVLARLNSVGTQLTDIKVEFEVVKHNVKEGLAKIEDMDEAIDNFIEDIQAALAIDVAETETEEVGEPE